MCRRARTSSQHSETEEASPVYQKVEDCRDASCAMSLFHPDSLYRNGCAVLPSGDHHLLLRSRWVHTKPQGDHTRVTMRVNVQHVRLPPMLFPDFEPRPESKARVDSPRPDCGDFENEWVDVAEVDV
ncbi:hypothetical protein MKEN_00560700 [Mycena kentingensis (nom. inval.)]|nr:hypothetical protein MKEN_00560700 [Mycena kentingensis (nom. inval.)]